MALKKKVTIKGYPAEYWKIIELRLDTIRNRTKIVVAVYKDRDTRLADVENYLEKYRYRKKELIYSIEQAYTYLKTLEEYETATDVFEETE